MAIWVFLLLVFLLLAAVTAAWFWNQKEITMRSLRILWISILLGFAWDAIHTH